MTPYDREAWQQLVKLAATPYAQGNLSLKRKQAILAADRLIQQYERNTTAQPQSIVDPVPGNSPKALMAPNSPRGV